MAASTVNIADFRCRGLKERSTDTPQGAAQNPGGLKIVDRQTAPEEREPAVSTATGDSPAVREIGVRREPQHMQRLILRPALISRNRSNLVRFNEPHVTVMKVKQPYAIQSWAELADDYDHPPAA